MPAKILDGKDLAKRLASKLEQECRDLKASGIEPRIASVQVAGDDASSWYIRNQSKQAAKVGVAFDHLELPANTCAEELEQTLHDLNHNPAISGIILQVPLPAGLDGQAFQQMILPAKDIEGMTLANLGRLFNDGDDLVPCTARAAAALVDDSGIEVTGKHAVVVGRSAIVGKPLAMMMLARNATVSICHSRTADLPAICRQADILLCAVGRKPGMVTADFIKPGAMVVDIATIALEDGSITGDVDTSSVSEVAGWLAPVPGGVGPVTVSMLMRNALIAARRQQVNR